MFEKEYCFTKPDYANNASEMIEYCHEYIDLWEVFQIVFLAILILGVITFLKDKYLVEEK